MLQRSLLVLQEECELNGKISYYKGTCVGHCRDPLSQPNSSKVNHVNPSTGQPVPVCDREIVRQCVTSWFGAEDKFDDSVRSIVAHSLLHQLGVDAFPYTWILGSTAPISWTFFDYLATYQAAEEAPGKTNRFRV